MMRIDCYLSPGCASEEALRKNITRALTIEKVKADVKAFNRSFGGLLPYLVTTNS